MNEHNSHRESPEITTTLSTPPLALTASVGASPPPAQPAEVLPEEPPSFGLAARLLRMADRYQDQYAVHQAIEIYFKLVEQYADTPSAGQARQRLLDIGDHYEANGEFHLARGIYERLS